MSASNGRVREHHFDAIVIGSGHNGLISAGYLAKAGKRVLVLERRDVIGGATVTEEAFPGYHLSICSYVCNLFLPEVVEDLQLRRYGYDLRPYDPSYFVPFPDGDHYIAYLDGERTRREIARHDPRDVAAYQRYWAMWGRIINRMRPLLELDAPGDDDIARAFDGLEGQADWHTLTERSVGDLLDEHFHSERLKAAFCTGGVIGVNAGPRTPGTCYVKYHHLIGSIDGHQGAWGFVRGGMGSVATSLASFCRDAGVTIVTGAEVAEVDIAFGRAVGVRTLAGDRYTADVILSNADPQRTYLGMVREDALPADYAAGIRKIRSKGSVVKVLVGLGELPDFTAMPGTEIGPQHTGGIMLNPSMDALETAWQECARGDPSRRPMIDAYIQSATEEGLAPPGKHTLSLYVQYAPYDLAEGTWEERREAIGANIVETFAEYAPNLPGAIEHMQVLGPPDIERIIGITGGNIFHGEILPDQMFGNRPVPGYPSYRSPIDGLYLCGSGAWPGGAVFGAPGRNCARAVLTDLDRAHARG